YPHAASRWRTALPAKPARQRPADQADDPDRPAMYPGGTWHPPPVNLRRHRASPSDHADASGSAGVSRLPSAPLTAMGVAGRSPVQSPPVQSPPASGDAAGGT